MPAKCRKYLSVSGISQAFFYRLSNILSIRISSPLAGVLEHEVGHLVARRGAQQQLTQGLPGALVLSTYDPENPNS